MPLNQALRQLWKVAGYAPDFGSAAVVAPPKAAHIRAYHLTGAKYGISDVALSRIKVARFSDLNDPFELMALNLRRVKDRRALKSLRNRENDKTGLICFSSDWTSPVLWSHYGDKHRGVCLGFDVEKEFIQRVNYEEKRLDDFVSNDGRPLRLSTAQLALLKKTKYKHWEYEQELRMLITLSNTVREGSLHFWPFGRDLKLREVILGPHCPLGLKEVRQLVASRYQGVSTIRSRLAFKFFKVVPNARTVRRAA